MDPLLFQVLNNGFLAVIAICTALGAFLSFRANVNTTATRAAVEKQSETITKLEVNTNSMKDALVASTDLASRAQGKAEGIASERANPQVSSSIQPVEPAPTPAPIASPQVIMKEPGKKDVSAVNVRIIPDQVVPVKETK